MSFFQGDLDPIYLREQYRQVCLIKHSDKLSEGLKTRQQQVEQSSFTTTKLFHHLFKRTLNEPKPTTITTDPMNRLVSFHL
jgi:hypothetical protein